MFEIESNVKRCMEKYNLSREEATRIIKANNSDLSLQDLRYKYDNLSLGKVFPKWITPENLLHMCFNVVTSYNYSGYFWYYGLDEIAVDLYIWAEIRLNKLNNHNILRAALCSRCKTIMRDLVRRETIHLTSISIYSEKDTDGCSTNNDCSKLDLITEVEDLEDCCELEEKNLILEIASIPDKEVRGILVLGGYFIAGIAGLRNLVIEVYNDSTEKQKERIYEMCKDDKYLCDKLNLTFNNTTECKVAIGRILKVFNKRDKGYLYKYLLPYLNEYGFLPT